MANFDKIIDRYGTYCTQWDFVKDRFGKSGLLPFTISDMDFAAPKEILEVISKRNDHGVFGYSRWDHDDFKNAISFWYKERFDTEVDNSSILYAPSVIYGVSRLIELLSKEGDGVLVNTPAYDAFFNMIKYSNKSVIENRLVEDENGDFSINFDDLEEKAKASKVMLLCSPHNPTGKVFTASELEKILNIVKRNNIYLISDEIHMDFIYKPNKHIPIIKIAKEKGILDKVFLVTSNSKSFNISSLMGAYLFCFDSKIKTDFLNILKGRDGLSSPPIFFILALIESYNKCGYYMDELVSYISDNMDYVESFAKSNFKNKIIFKKPAGTYFALINTKNLNMSNEEIQSKLINTGNLAIMSGDNYKIENRLRLNLGAPRSKIITAMQSIEKSLIL